jgi:hypothetical protein
VTPALGHSARRFNGGEVTHAAQCVFAATVNDALRADRLAAAERVGFKQDRVIAATAQAVEAPKSGSAAAEHEHV